MTQDRLVTTAEAAAILGVSVRTVQRRVKHNVLVPVVRAPWYLFRRADIEALADRAA